MRKWIIWATALCAALAVTACGRDEEDHPPIIEMPWMYTPAPAPRETASPTIPIPGFVTGEREEAVIEFWHVSGIAQSDALLETLDAFHAFQPYIRVNEINHGNYAMLAAQIMLGDFSGTLPHVAVASASDVLRYRASLMLLPLDPFVNAPEVGMPREEFDDIFGALRAVGVYDGVRYSLPFTANVRLLFYNRDLITANGFIRAPETWEDLERAARVLTDSGGRRGIGFGGDFDSEWAMLLIRRGGTFFDSVTGRAAFATAEGIRAMESLIHMANGPYAYAAEDSGPLHGAFARGEIAMFFGWSDDIPRVASAVNDAFDWRTARVPESHDSFAAEMTGYDLVMFENVSHGIDARVGAWDFMRFTLQTDAAARWAIANHSVPVTQTALDSLMYSRFFNLNPSARGIHASADNGFFRVRHEMADNIRGILLESMDSMINGGVSAEVGLTQAEERVNALLAEGR
ncbi:MAG: extracellular solute-binding protein [Defluviitaleaceae bacterium]|nr:extracellular solute-binding protein [Defluviitaleaceae bacterium]